MPIHDWTKVPAGIFHDFHHEWISSIKRALNNGLLPSGYYALAEQIAGGMGPDVLTLEGPIPGSGSETETGGDEGGLAVATRPPRVRFQANVEEDLLAGRAKRVAVRHSSDHRVVAMIEIVAPGNKSSQYAIDAFARKAREALSSGIRLLIVDLFPPGPRDPRGLLRVIWDGDGVRRIPTLPDEPLACIAAVGRPAAEVFFEPTAVGQDLPEMPLFLTEGMYVPVPLEATYREAWDAVPAFWREAMTKASADPPA